MTTGAQSRRTPVLGANCGGRRRGKEQLCQARTKAAVPSETIA
jgi:hypothetical protein